MEGTVTDIQRFSLSDGDGIRTTVFLKGCNMKCEWCHNPETISAECELMFYESKCIGCKKCFSVCPTGAHKVVDGKHIIDRALCKNCGKCAETCYAEALAMCGRKMSVEDVMKQIRQDKAYYDSSNGGVTLSGGEVMCQSEFVLELINACKKENIKTALETNISFPFDKISKVLKTVDLVMCDIKIFDDEIHKKYTGISNKSILENIIKLDALNIPFIVRTPLIPGVTDSIENILDTARFIKDFRNLKRYELLNFNPLGEAKYKGLDRENVFEKSRPLSQAKLEELKQSISNIGILVKIV